MQGKQIVIVCSFSSHEATSEKKKKGHIHEFVRDKGEKFSAGVKEGKEMGK